MLTVTGRDRSRYDLIQPRPFRKCCMCLPLSLLSVAGVPVTPKQLAALLRVAARGSGCLKCVDWSKQFVNACQLSTEYSRSHRPLSDTPWIPLLVGQEPRLPCSASRQWCRHHPLFTPRSAFYHYHPYDTGGARLCPPGVHSTLPTRSITSYREPAGKVV